jgi:glycerate kinase
MRVVAAVNGWPGDELLDARAAAVAVAQAWGEAAPGTTIDSLPVGDGGPRTADAWVGERSLAGGAEAVTCGGMTWLAPTQGAVRWNPLDLSTALLGLAAADTMGSIVIPVGDVPPAGDAADLWGGALAPVRKAVRGLDLVVLATSRRQLLGFHGMSAALIDGREGDDALAAAAQAQERRWAEIAREADAIAGRDSLMRSWRLSDQPGTGAAGGLSYALAALGARIIAASSFLVEASGLADAAANADLVVGVGGDLTPSSLDEGVATSVAAVAARGGVPATMLTTAVNVGRRDLMAAGLSSAHEGQRGRVGLVDGVRRVAHTWAAR